MKLDTGFMSAAAVLIAMTAVAAPQGGGSGGSSGNPGTSSASGGSSGSTGGSSGSMGGTSGGMHDSMGSSSGSMQDSSSSHMGGAMGAASGGQLTGDERRFLMEAASAGMLEIQAGKMAAQQARDPQAKAYAERMVREHTRNSQKLTSIAQAHGITPPEKLMPKHQAMLDKLQRAKTGEFDQAYGRLMDTSHKDTVQSYQSAQKTVKNPQLAAYIQESLPVLQEHHADAKQLPGSQGSRQALGGSQGRGPSASDRKGSPDNTNGRDQRQPDRETTGRP
ncbi:MAG: DUF4142 domain-containing protein [Steroidobacteraceae bacterium]|jgi:putative membrane protein|nr:DUF4142 domain-containing protein [Steroidobacteraceae bacterium]